MERGPSNYEVIEVLTDGSTWSHGVYWTLGKARLIVLLADLGEYEIWQGDHIVEERTRDWRNVRAMESGEGSGDWPQDIKEG
jgi:hypothetical protein